ncbi:hypothetical protein AVEN_271206-1, partial [Araneus ventricosus]
MSERTFYRLLKNNLTVRIRCGDCTEAMTLDDFYKEHAPNRHGLGKRSECVFCFGGYDWKRGERRRRSNWTHMIECLKSFVKTNRIRETPAEAPAETPPEPPMCG